MVDNDLYATLHHMVVEPVSDKTIRYGLVKELLGTLVFRRRPGSACTQLERSSTSPVNLAGILLVLDELRRSVILPPTGYPRQTVFQEFALTLARVSDGQLDESSAMEMGWWLEGKFDRGAHPFWGHFLCRAALEPLSIDHRILPWVLVPLEAVLHSLDDYIDTGESTPSARYRDLRLGLICIAALPGFLAQAAGLSMPDSNHPARDLVERAWNAFASALEVAVEIPSVEDGTPDSLGAANGFEDEMERGAFNIDARTRGTTGVFLQPLMAMLPSRSEVLVRLWEGLWLCRAAEMVTKDAIFDVEVDILNRDHTPASVWAERFGVDTEAWYSRVQALFDRYKLLWSTFAADNTDLLAGELRSSLESRMGRNRFLLSSIRPSSRCHRTGKRDNSMHIVAIASGKGGVGKSTVAWLVAKGLSRRGLRVGVLDADAWGPSQATLFRAGPAMFQNGDLVPSLSDRVAVVSLGQFVGAGDPILLRGSIAARLVRELALRTLWPDIDYLVIDLPPGGSDIHTELVSIMPSAEFILVTLPQPLAVADTRRTHAILSALDMNVHGLVLNMTSLQCETCGAARNLGRNCSAGLPQELAIDGLPLLARLPFDPALAESHPSDYLTDSSIQTHAQRVLRNELDWMLTDLVSKRPGVSEQTLILVDECDQLAGYAGRDECHEGDGRLHRAIAVVLHDGKGRILLQSRKSRLWDGYWDITAATHPLHVLDGNESYEDATARCLAVEWGISTPVSILGTFRYHERIDGHSENEYCTLLVGEFCGHVRPNNEFANGMRWIRWDDLLSETHQSPDSFTPWALRSIDLIAQSGLFDSAKWQGATNMEVS